MQLQTQTRPPASAFTAAFKRHIATTMHSSWPNWSVVSSSTAGPHRDGQFYGRELELKSLHELCTGVPTSITVILGPRNSGKTRLLQHFVHSTYLQPTDQTDARYASSSDTAAAAAAAAAASPHSNSTNSRAHINARVVRVSTPQDMARALQEHSMPPLVRQLEVLEPFVGEGLHLLSAVGGFVSSMQERMKANAGGDLSSDALTAALETFLLGKAELELAAVLAAYHKVLDEYHQGRSKKQSQLAARLEQQQQLLQRLLPVPSMPVLVLDEANVLMQWSTTYPEDLAALLRFFISVTKECNGSHVVLATSDSSFHAWLSKEIGPAFFQSFVVGDFPSSDARRFLDQQLSRQQRGPVSDEGWALVQQVCGGNAGALCSAATSYRLMGEWVPALQHVTKDIAGSMWCGMFPPSTATYTAKDYAAAVQLLLSSQCGAVDQAVVLQALPGGLLALQGMVAANLLALRPYSDWASDIPAEAFGPSQHCMAITPPSPMHHYLMKVKKSDLLQPLLGSVEHEDKAAHGVDTGCHQVSGSSPVGGSGVISAADSNIRTSTDSAGKGSSGEQARSHAQQSSPSAAAAATAAAEAQWAQQKLVEVQAAIARMDQQLSSLASQQQGLAAAAAAAPANDGRQAEVAALRHSCALLQEEKLQLRQMELLLLRAWLLHSAPMG